MKQGLGPGGPSPDRAYLIPRTVAASTRTFAASFGGMAARIFATLAIPGCVAAVTIGLDGRAGTVAVRGPAGGSVIRASLPARGGIVMPQALFITIEGVDGAGKSTHLPAIARWLGERGHDVVQTREPGGSALAEHLRALVLQQPMDALTEALLRRGYSEEALLDILGLNHLRVIRTVLG